MKKLITSLCAIAIYGFAFSQDVDHHHIDANKNITPYNDAAEARNGVSHAHLRKQTAWKNFATKYPNWGVSFDMHTQLPHRAIGEPISFSAGGNDAMLKAKAFLQHEFEAFNLPMDELVLTRNFNDGKFIHVDFKQIHHGMEVLWSRVGVRFTQDLKIVMFIMDAHRNIPVLNASITPNSAIQYAEQAIVTKVLNSEIDAKLYWFPMPTQDGFNYRPVYKVTVNTQDDEITPGKYLTYVDAIDGAIIYRQNKVVHVGFNVNANLYPTNLFSPQANLPLKNILVNVGAVNYYSDLSGNVTVPGTTPVDPTLSLSGKFIKIVTGQNGTTSPTFTTTNIANNASVTFPQSTPNATERHMTCYYHANEIHDFMKTKFPTFTAMDNPLTTRVDRTDGNCNAFYDGASINFYTTANGCNALSLISDVMYHEYGHGITNVFWDNQGSSFDNGAQGEGYSDIWAIGLTKTPIIGPGFNVNQPNSYIRRYDINPKIYPQNIIGEVHADGEIIAGAWYDYAIKLGGNFSLAADTMSELFAATHYGLATGPDGAEGQVYHDILIDALEYDDNNNNINDGTPHFFQIVEAFADHGIFLLSQTELEHQAPGVVVSGTTVPINTTASADYPAFLGNVKMFYRKKATTTLDSLLLVKNALDYSANFPVTSTGDIFEYYFTIYDFANVPSVNSPIESKFNISSLQRNLPHFLIAGYNSVYLENFDSITSTTPNWKIGSVTGDGATASGRWVVAIPVASKTTTGDTVQTGKDHTTGTGKCAITGNATSSSSSVGNADVDAGRTSLITQAFDLSTYNKPIITYWRWFSNSQGSNARKDHWRVYGSYNNGTTWFQLERTYQPDVSWRKNLFIPDVTQGTTFKMMYVAIDTANSTTTGGSLVEAAIDDIEILEYGNGPAGIRDIAQLESSVYPNPTQNELNIMTNENGNLKYELYNAIGQVILSGNEKAIQRCKIDVNSISNGLYFMKLTMNGKQSIHKVTIKK